MEWIGVEKTGEKTVMAWSSRDRRVGWSFGAAKLGSNLWTYGAIGRFRLQLGHEYSGTINPLLENIYLYMIQEGNTRKRVQAGGMESSSSSSREQQMRIVCMRSSPTAGGEEARELESSRSALSLFKEKEEEIERKKLEVREKVFSMLGRVEEETKRLAFIRQELEVMADPTRREAESIRKRMDKVNRQLKPLGKSCLKKEKEYKMCLEAYNEKSNEKAMLANRLMELVSESERLRMKKLEELSKTMETLYLLDPAGSGPCNFCEMGIDSV